MGIIQQDCAYLTCLVVQEYCQTPAVAHFQAVRLDEEDGKVSAAAGLMLLTQWPPRS